MKPSSNFLFGRSFVFISSVIALTAGATAAPIVWSGATGGSWADGANWTPNSVPGPNDVATFNITGAPVTINLNGNREVAGLSTPATGLTNVHNLLGGGTDSILTIGASGITHLRGGITIGSGTAGQRVDVALSDSQIWNSSRTDGSGNAQAIFVNNNVTLNPDLGTRTLTLTGTNTGSFIGGVISNGSNSTLNIIKSDTGTWSLNGVNTYTGTTQVNGGILRLAEAGTLAPSSISVAGGATLALRLEATVGGAGFSEAEISSFVSGATFASGSFVGLDTSNGNATYTGNLSGVGFAKTGGNYLILSGSVSPVGSAVVREGGLILANASALSSPVTVTNNAMLIARAGGSGFTSAQISALRASATFEGTSFFGIGTANGDFNFGNVLANQTGVTVRFVKADANTLFLTGQNTYTGGTQINTGTLSVSEIKNGSVASQMGMSGNVANGIILAGGRLQYTGVGHTTDRLFNLTGSSAIESSGTGALVFGSTSTISAEGGSRTLTLTGYNQDDNRLGLNLANVVNVTSVVKGGYGKWILSGNNTHTGSTTVRGGTLVLDYTGGKTPLAATGQLLVGNGTAILQGSGAKTIGALNFSESENGFATTKITGGMALTATSLTSGTTSQRMVLIDLNGSGNTLSYGALGTGLTNSASGNLLLTNGSRSNIVVRANDGTYGFAAAVPANSGAPTGAGSIQKLGGQTAVATGTFTNVTSETTSYIFAAGDYTSGANLTFQTLTFDSSGGAINVNFASGNAITSTSGSTGRGVLFTGTNNVTFSGAGGAVTQSSVFFNNYLEDSAQLNIQNSLGSTYFLIGGTGFTNYTGSTLPAAEFVQNGGLFRVATAQNLTGIYRINSGVFEVGAGLSGGAAFDLNQTSARFRLLGDAGFSAHGANRTVSLGGDMVWGTSNFLVTAFDGSDGDYAFKLSSTRSDSTVDFTSNINLNGKLRGVDVANGGAAVDARLSGNLTGSGIASGLLKYGAGTLELTGTNNYSGITRVEEGRLLVGGGGLTATTSIHVQNATLAFGGQEVINDSADIILENGTIVTGGAEETLGRLTIIGANTLDLAGLGNIIRMANSSSLVWSSSLSILNWNGNSGGNGSDRFYIGTDGSGVTGSQLSNIFFVDPTVDGVLHTGTFGSSIIGSTGEIVAVIPEPSSVALLAMAASGLALRRRRR